MLTPVDMHLSYNLLVITKTFEDLDDLNRDGVNYSLIFVKLFEIQTKKSVNKVQNIAIMHRL